VVKVPGSKKKELNNYIKYFKKTGKYFFPGFFYFILVCLKIIYIKIRLHHF